MIRARKECCNRKGRLEKNTKAKRMLQGVGTKQKRWRKRTRTSHTMGGEGTKCPNEQGGNKPNQFGKGRFFRVVWGKVLSGFEHAISPKRPDTRTKPEVCLNWTLRKPPQKQLGNSLRQALPDGR